MNTCREMIRFQFDLITKWKQILTDAGVCVREQQGIIRECRERIAQMQKRNDPLAKPITADWRHGYKDDGESGYDYIIIPDDGSTDDELSDWFDCEVAYPPIYSPFDCTGKRFTCGKHIKRTPAGVVVIHRWSLDI